jgi:hypothetical protein
MTQTQNLRFSFVDMNGTASRKRGWLVFTASFAKGGTVVPQPAKKQHRYARAVQ